MLITQPITKLFQKVIYSFNLVSKPTYKIDFLRPDSPALKAGLEVGDIIIEINGKPAYEKKIPEIIMLLSKKEGQKINLLVDRNGRHFRCNFVLKDLL
ncbi:MAG: PDZ domain-containing protein [Flavobacteriaceae bacterium]|nr:PDZ domain-containing protein [Flavobacteriaceae bacterium]